MDKAQSEHLARVHHLRESFVEANERLVARLRRVSDEAAERESDGAWSAAQIGWHVAAVTTRFAALIAGDIDGPQPLPEGFCERPWAEVAATVPARAMAPSAVTPVDDDVRPSADRRPAPDAGPRRDRPDTAGAGPAVPDAAALAALVALIVLLLLWRRRHR